MNVGAIRKGALCALITLIAACSGGSPAAEYTPPPIKQADFTKSLATYMAAAGTNFQGFSNDPPLVGSSECNIDNAGKDNATAECKVNSFNNEKDAMKLYSQQKGLLAKALPGDARGAEQKDAAPNTPLRFAAASGKSGAVLILTQNGADWIVGYVFQKVPGK